MGLPDFLPIIVCVYMVTLIFVRRTHQIRVHLQHRRTPILGDSAYGNKEWNQRLLRSDAVERPLLHAYETAFTHPFTGERVVLRAPVPADMARLLQRLGHTGDRLVDPATGYLVGSTEVQEQRIVEQRRGFVPMDRIRTEEVSTIQLHGCWNC